MLPTTVQNSNSNNSVNLTASEWPVDGKKRWELFYSLLSPERINGRTFVFQTYQAKFFFAVHSMN